MKCADHPNRDAVVICDFYLDGKYFIGVCSECWKKLKKDINKIRQVS